MADPTTFGNNMRARGEEIRRNSDRLVRRVALAVDGTVVLATPVDTGRARSNWQVELGQPAEGEIPAYAEGKGRSTEGANSRAALEQGKEVIARYNGDAQNASVHITNNLGYIGKLNDGWSAQAPAGFVEKAVHVGVDAIRSAGGLMGHTISEE